MSGADFTPWPASAAQEYRARGYWKGQTLGRFLRALADHHGDRTALFCGERRWSYLELDERADRLAAGLYDLGLKAGDHAVVQLPNVAEFFAVCFACFRAGVIPVLALPGHRAAEIGSFCGITGAVAYFVADRHEGFDYLALAEQVQAASPALRHVIVLGGSEAKFTALDSLYHAPRTLPERDAGDVALLQLSGGSTGTPKLIPRTHDDYLYSVRASVPLCGFDTRTVYLAALPVAHNFPLSSPGTLGALHAGATIVLAPRPDAAGCFALIALHGVTHAALVPSLLLLWLEEAPRHRTALTSLQRLLVGGATLPADTARRVRPQLGCDLQQVFGMAEGLVNYTRLDDTDERIAQALVWPISEADEIRVVDDADQDVPPGNEGHLLTRGPYTVRGYFRAAEHNLRAFTADGFYRTGDRVRRLADGALQVVGRSKDQINRGGEKIAAEEIEHHLVTHPQVRNAALVSIPDAWLGERSCAFVELEAPDSLAPARLAMQLKLYLKGRGLAAYKIPDRIEFIERLPLTAPGKVAKQILRARLLPASS